MKTRTRSMVIFWAATLVWGAASPPADAARTSEPAGHVALAGDVAPVWPVPAYIPPAPPPIPAMPAAGQDTPPAGAIVDRVTLGAECGGWTRQTAYAGRWPTAMTWWEFACARSEVTYHNVCTSVACDAFCPFCSTQTETWTDRFVWDGTTASFYGELYDVTVQYDGDWGDWSSSAWWDVASSQWYDANRYPLDVFKGGDGAGTVTSTPAGIDCGATCEMLVDAGGSVTLTATAGHSSVFTGWSAPECAGTGPCSLPIGHGRGVTATFEATSFDLRVTKAGSGSGRVRSTPAGIDCESICQASYAPGTPVTLDPMPDTGSLFAGWSGDCRGGGSCQVTLDRGRAVTATFVPIVHRPDAVIRTGPAGAWVGDGVYDVTGVGESVTASVARGSTVSFEVQVQNDGNVTDTVAIAGGAGTSDITLRYADAAGDITTAVVAGTYRTDAIAPGASRSITMTATIAHRTRTGTQLSIPFTVVAGGSADRVVAILSVSSH